MSRVLLAAAIAAIMPAIATTTDARAQELAGPPLAASTVDIVVPVVPNVLDRRPYGPEMLPASLSRPYVIVPRYGFGEYADPSLHWGYRTSPYGDYGRYNFTNTGPFPGMLRPYVWFPHDHHKKCQTCGH